MKAGKAWGREGNMVNEYHTYMKMFSEKPRLCTRKVHFKNKMFGQEMARRGKVLLTNPDNLSSGSPVRSHGVEVLVHDPSTWELRAAEVWGIVHTKNSYHWSVLSSPPGVTFSKPGQARWLLLLGFQLIQVTERHARWNLPSGGRNDGIQGFNWLHLVRSWERIHLGPGHQQEAFYKVKPCRSGTVTPNYDSFPCGHSTPNIRNTTVQIQFTTKSLMGSSRASMISSLSWPREWHLFLVERQRQSK